MRSVYDWHSSHRVLACAVLTVVWTLVAGTAAWSQTKSPKRTKSPAQQVPSDVTTASASPKNIVQLVKETRKAVVMIKVRHKRN